LSRRSLKYFSDWFFAVRNNLYSNPGHRKLAHQQNDLLRASLKTQNYPSLLEKGRDEANKKTVFRDALK